MNNQDVQAAEAKREKPVGKWIKNDMFTCDQCGFRLIVGDGDYSRCPECKAVMLNG